MAQQLTPKRNVFNDYFTSSPLSTPASSPQKPIVVDSDEDEDDDSVDDESTEVDNGTDSAADSLQLRPGLNDEYSMRRTDDELDADLIEEGGEDVFEVEAILKKKGTGKNTFYKIRWVRLPPVHAFRRAYIALIEAMSCILLSNRKATVPSTIRKCFARKFLHGSTSTETSGIRTRRLQMGTQVKHQRHSTAQGLRSTARRSILEEAQSPP